MRQLGGKKDKCAAVYLEKRSGDALVMGADLGRDPWYLWGLPALGSSMLLSGQGPGVKGQPVELVLTWFRGMTFLPEKHQCPLGGTGHRPLVSRTASGATSTCPYPCRWEGGERGNASVWSVREKVERGPGGPEPAEP